MFFSTTDPLITHIPNTHLRYIYQYIKNIHAIFKIQIFQIRITNIRKIIDLLKFPRVIVNIPKLKKRNNVECALIYNLPQNRKHQLNVDSKMKVKHKRAMVTIAKLVFFY